jgi:hypothetical protein
MVLLSAWSWSKSSLRNMNSVIWRRNGSLGSSELNGSSRSTVLKPWLICPKLDCTEDKTTTHCMHPIS